MAKSPAPLIGNASGPLLILGSGGSLGRDLRRVRHMEWRGDKMCVNRTGLLYPLDFRHWATIHGDVAAFHPNNMDVNHLGAGWKRSRGKMLWKSCLVHSARTGRHDRSLVCEWMYEWGEDYFPRPWRNGASGLFAVEIALLMGYDPIVLAGCPLDHSGYCWDAGDWPRQDLGWITQVQKGTTDIWTERAKTWNGRVTSLSGWTGELLGEPTWLSLTSISDEMMNRTGPPVPQPVVLSPRMSALLTQAP